MVPADQFPGGQVSDHAGASPNLNRFVRNQVTLVGDKHRGDHRRGIAVALDPFAGENAIGRVS